MTIDLRACLHARDVSFRCASDSTDRAWRRAGHPSAAKGVRRGAARWGGFDFKDYFVALREIPPGVPRALDAMKKARVPVFAYGSFLTVALNFLILAFIVFLMVKQFNRLRRAEPPPPPPAPPEEVVLLRDIRDALRR
ncbi:MscL family protein [Anaeromyxobacter dehalogenans]|uniref:Large-conductance mechanosensitive channel-like protein n=1 Tax=Anaeromyxobacter dehalogenans (strain 2CP-C) TaxID=290397 RepID=Q2IFL2_ANADE|nr:Large-conductance mechanosensitive channel-like protein [Anaeromyxobacter dehalogenans 2CP-C]